MYKKILSIGLFFLTLCSLAACGDNNRNTAEDIPTETEVAVATTESDVGNIEKKYSGTHK